MILNEQRELLFRGKKTIANEWVYGYPCAPIEIVGRKPIHAISTTAKLTRDMGRHFASPFNGDMCREAYEVYPATIGQYTGFTDCEGTKIFEFDIVNIAYKENSDSRYCWGFVVMDNGRWCVRVSRFDGYDNISFAELKKKQAIKMIVRGNVFDNFELLEGENCS